MAELESVYYGIGASYYDMPPEYIKEGRSCAVMYHRDTNWHRGKILEVDHAQNKARIVYLDYGDSELVAFEDIKFLDKRFGALPVQAVSAKLHNIKKTSQLFSGEVMVKYLLDKTRGSPLIAKTMGVTQVNSTQLFSLDIIVKNTHDSKIWSLNQQVVKDGFGRIVDETKQAEFTDYQTFCHKMFDNKLPDTPKEEEKCGICVDIVEFFKLNLKVVLFKFDKHVYVHCRHLVNLLEISYEEFYYHAEKKSVADFSVDIGSTDANQELYEALLKISGRKIASVRVYDYDKLAEFVDVAFSDKSEASLKKKNLELNIILASDRPLNECNIADIQEYNAFSERFSREMQSDYEKYLANLDILPLEVPGPLHDNKFRNKYKAFISDKIEALLIQMRLMDEKLGAKYKTTDNLSWLEKQRVSLGTEFDFLYDLLESF